MHDMNAPLALESQHYRSTPETEAEEEPELQFEQAQQNAIDNVDDLSTSLGDAAKPLELKLKAQEDIQNEIVVVERVVSRTPPPSPSEVAFLSKDGFFDWQRMKNWRFWFRRKWIWYYIIFGTVITLIVLIAHFNKTIVRELEPVSQRLRHMRGGWLVPIAILFVISFPPLLGHELVAILCGVIWGFGIGFGITCAGTLLGEIGNFYAFRYCCRVRGNKFEKKNLYYACLVQVIREGSFKITLIARYSAIPGHLLTAIFSTCGMNILVFTLAATLSLPKQAFLVYVGVILEENGFSEESQIERIISGVTVAATVVVTIVAMRYLHRRMSGVKQVVVYARRKARQMKREHRNSIDSISPPNFTTSTASPSGDNTEIRVPIPSYRPSSPVLHYRPRSRTEYYDEYPLSTITRA